MAELTATGALGSSLVAWHGGPLPGDGVVGFESFYRDGRLWIGAARVPDADEVSVDTLRRTLGVVRGLSELHPSPAALIAAVHDELVSDGERNSEVALFVAALATASGELACASAGHRAPWVTGPAGARALPVTVGPPIGDAHHDYIDCLVALGPDDVLVIPASGTPSAEGISALAAHADDPATPADPAIVLRPAAAVGPVPLHTLDLSIGSELDAIDRVTSRFDAFAAAHHVPDAVRRTFDIAFDDLINNVVSYAYRGEPDHVIDVRVVLDPRGLEASLADDGPAFDPFAMDEPDTDLDLDDRDIGGLGVHLVRTMMDEARHERRDGRNVVTIKKYIR